MKKGKLIMKSKKLQLARLAIALAVCWTSSGLAENRIDSGRDSAADVVGMCSSVANLDIEKYQSNLAKIASGKGSLSEDDASTIVAVTYCGTLITAITTTVAVADDYRLKDGSRLCVHPDESGVSVARYLLTYGKAHPEMVNNPELDAESFVITALKERPCPTS